MSQVKVLIRKLGVFSGYHRWNFSFLRLQTSLIHYTGSSNSVVTLPQGVSPEDRSSGLETDVESFPV